jgi:undecaprenyl-diphosphatase
MARERSEVAAWLAGGLVVLLLIGWGLGALAQSSTTSADLDAVRDVAAQRRGALTAFAHVLSFVGSGYVVFPLALVCCVAFYRRGWPAATIALALSTLGGVVMANVDKLLVGRARPPVHHLEHVASMSFPSGHATQATAFYVALLLIFLASGRSRQMAPAAVLGMVLLIGGIAASRVYLGVHYPSDTIAGILLGAAWSALTCTLMLRRERAQPPRFAPRT